MPAPRRVSARSARRRRQIVDAALGEVRAKAVADVSLSAIAARAGLRPSHVLYYFESRDDVLIAAVEHAETQLAAGRAERLEAIDASEARLAAFVGSYLPEDHHDPVWKLWIEGWLHSPSRAHFATVGRRADQGWHAALVACLEHAQASGSTLPDPAPAVARRLLFLLDGLAVHVLAGHVDQAEAAGHAMAALRAEVGGLAAPAGAARTLEEA